MKYFIINGLLPYPDVDNSSLSRRTEQTKNERLDTFKLFDKPIPLQGEKLFLSVKSIGSISVIVFEIDRALILIKSRSQRKAYHLFNLFRSLANVFLGLSFFEKSYYYLIELNLKPTGDISNIELINSVKIISDNWIYEHKILNAEIYSGYQIGHDQIDFICNTMKILFEYSNLQYALYNLEYSHYLCSGFMSGSFYQHHYRHERGSISKYENEKIYFENRIKYEIAFLSAFKSIESILEVTNINKNQTIKYLENVDKKYGTNFTNQFYQSYYEIFSSYMKNRTYYEMINHFLHLRNIIAAHSNYKSGIVINQDNLFEIQFFSKNMIDEICYTLEKND